MIVQCPTCERTVDAIILAGDGREEADRTGEIGLIHCTEEGDHCFVNRLPADPADRSLILDELQKWQVVPFPPDGNSSK